jgi:hypothetical protein
MLRTRNGKFIGALAVLILLYVLGVSTVAAARCQIASVSYTYPKQVEPNQQIEVDTRVVGSCASSGLDYYSVRVDLVDANSTNTISRSSTPIGYIAGNFTVTAKNFGTAPSYNSTWPIQMYVYVVRAGGTSGPYLFDYRTVGNATIQVGGMVPVPEFQTGLLPVFTIMLVVAAVAVARRRRSKVV